MSRPATRILAFLELLQDHPGIGGRELAQRLEVEPRTIRRYAVKLQELGIPVEAERGRAGGYRLRPGYRLPPLMFADDEATAVTLGLLAARRLGAAEEQDAVDRALAKVLRVLPAPVRERALALHEAVAFTAPGREPEPAPTEMVLSVADAVRRRRRLRIRHRDAAGRATTREIDPYGLVHHRGRWYVAAHDGLRDAPRTFRADRIEHAAVLPTPATPPPDGFDATEHVLETLAVGGWRHAVDVVLHTTPDAARARIGPGVAELRPVGDGVLLRTRVERLDGMARFLAGLDLPFTVVRPPELTDELRTLAERILRSAPAR